MEIIAPTLTPERLYAMDERGKAWNTRERELQGIFATRKEADLTNQKEPIVELIRAHPGISSREISKRLGIPQHKLSGQMAYLRDRMNLINNQGKDGRAFLWFPVTKETEDRIPFIGEARTILEELSNTPPAHRERRLAELLQERSDESHHS